jgi:hypothetical protein
LGKISFLTASFYMLKAIIWATITYLIIKFMWHQGNQKYGAYGQ